MNKSVITKVEKEMLELYANGYKKKEIAKIYGISYNICRRKYKEICNKLKVSNTTLCIMKVLFNREIKNYK